VNKGFHFLSAVYAGHPVTSV